MVEIIFEALEIRQLNHVLTSILYQINTGNYYPSFEETAVQIIDTVQEILAAGSITAEHKLLLTNYRSLLIRAKYSPQFPITIDNLEEQLETVERALNSLGS